MKFCNKDWSFQAKGVATRSNKNEQSCSQVNTKRFRSLLDQPHKNEDSPVVRSGGKKERNAVVFLLSQLYCLKMSRGFRFLKQKPQQIYYFTKEIYCFNIK